jgi:hypothetical protein
VQRIRLEGIRNHPWFRKNYVPVRGSAAEETPDLDDVHSVFDNSKVFSPSLVSLMSKRRKKGYAQF